MLAQQHSEIVKVKGEVVFSAEDDEDRLSGTSWKLEEDVFDQVTETGFKLHLIELLDNFIQYRGQCDELPKKEGVVRFGSGELSIEWLPDGSINASFRSFNCGGRVAVLTKDDLYQLVNEFERLPGQIDELSKSAFEKVYGSEKAAKAKGIVYFLLSSKPVPRLRGESRILYIGQTKASFKSRYFRYANLHATSDANSLKYKEIIKNYGPIEIAFCDYQKFGGAKSGNPLLQAEGQFLWWYFQNHCEYPPINYTKTKVRTKAIST
jgi:hypothetical protein